MPASDRRSRVIGALARVHPVEEPTPLPPLLGGRRPERGVAHEVGAGDRLDLDHVGAERREHVRGGRARPPRRAVDDAESLEGTTGRVAGAGKCGSRLPLDRARVLADRRRGLERRVAPDRRSCTGCAAGRSGRTATTRTRRARRSGRPWAASRRCGPVRTERGEAPRPRGPALWISPSCTRAPWLRTRRGVSNEARVARAPACPRTRRRGRSAR